jgi:hypothetical protein
MRVLGVLAAWGVLAVLATLCFAVGGSIGYRRGVQDAVRQLRERRSGKTGCRPLPLPHHRRRPITRMHASPMRTAQVRAAAPPAIHRLRAQFSRSNLSPLLAGAMAMVVLLTVPGVAVGATTAQPGETLWPVKRGMERARLAMATGPDSDMQIHVELASRRLNELNLLLATGGADPQVVDEVITDLRGHTEAASEQLHEVEPAARRHVAERVEQVVHRQVIAIRVLLNVDCTEQVSDDQCVALGDTREVADQLQKTVRVAVAGNDAVAGTPSDPVGATADRRSEAGLADATALASTRPDTAASSAERPGEPSSAAVAGSEATSEQTSESPSARPASGSTTQPAVPAAPAAAAAEEEPPADDAATAKPAQDASGNSNGKGADAAKPAERGTAQPAP